MKPEEINRAIDEARGYDHAYGERVVIAPDRSGEPEIVSHEPIPCYHESLDACAEFERALTPRELVEYSYGLMDITRTTYEAITATAAQRCEAYLRMKGLWNE